MSHNTIRHSMILSNMTCYGIVSSGARRGLEVEVEPRLRDAVLRRQAGADRRLVSMLAL